MELHQIRYFLAVVEKLNFTRAAEACNVTQPSLTRGIRKLETDLGGLLFERKPGGIELTELGRTLLPSLKSIDGAIGTAVELAQNMRQTKKRRLRLGLACTLGPQRLLDVVQRLEKRIPDLELSLSEIKSSDVVDRLLAGEIDIGVACQPKYPDEIAATPLFKERFGVAFPQGHRFQALSEVPLDEVINENYVERLNCEFDDYFALHFGDRPFPLNIRFSSEREDWVQAMIMAGLGVSFVPEGLPLQSGLLRAPICQPEMQREVALLTVRGRPHSVVIDNFLRIAASLKW